MSPLISYSIKVNIAIVLFYLFYLLFMQKDTFLQAKRFFFLSAILFSFIYPLITVGALNDFFEPAFSRITTAEVSIENPTAVTMTEGKGSISLFPWRSVITMLWGLVTLFFTIRLIWQLISLSRLRGKSEKESIEGMMVYRLEQQTTPFSFFRWIFIFPEQHSETELRQILLHEKVHVEQFHSIDILLMELLSTLFWWNPFVWLMKREVTINLEYLADQGVLRHGIDSRDYQYHLLQLTYQETAVQIVNNFNVSQLKQRIIMMNQRKSPDIKRAKYLLVLPLFLALIMTNSLLAQNQEPVKKKEQNKTTQVIKTDQDKAEQDKAEQDKAEQDKAEQDKAEQDKIKQVKTTQDETTQDETTQDKTTQDKTTQDKIKQVKTTQDKTKQEKADNDEVFVVVENSPKFPGGEAALMKFLSDNIKYPVEAHKNGIQGRVICSFVVEKDGSLSDFNIVRSVDPLLDNESIRVLSSMPNWEPGTQRGKAVRVRFTLPIMFMLTKNDGKSK